MIFKSKLIKYFIFKIHIFIKIEYFLNFTNK